MTEQITPTNPVAPTNPTVNLPANLPNPLSRDKPSLQAPTVAPQPLQTANTETQQTGYQPGSLPSNNHQNDNNKNSTQNRELEVLVRTMKTDIAELVSKGVGGVKTTTLTPLQKIPPKSVAEGSFEAKIASPVPPRMPQMPSRAIPPAVIKPGAPPPLRVEYQRPQEPPILIVPPKGPIPSKVITSTLPTRPLPKAFPAWLKIGLLAFATTVVTFFGLYAYWKVFIQQGLPIVQPPPPSQEPPRLPEPPVVPTPLGVKFFNKLPTKAVTIDLPQKTPAALSQALSNEAKAPEARASVKQIVLTYQNKPITLKEFFDLFKVFTPREFLLNYRDEFALVFYNQKEGARASLLLKPNDSNLAKNQMLGWERSTFASDILPLFLGNLKTVPPRPEFKEYVYAGQTVRFINVNQPFASLNYAIYNGNLIITTSSPAMFVILQDMTGLKVSSLNF